MYTRLKMPATGWSKPRYLRASNLFCMIPAADGRSRISLEVIRHGMWTVRRDWYYCLTILDPENNNTWVEFQYFHVRRLDHLVRINLGFPHPIGRVVLAFDDGYRRANVSISNFGVFRNRKEATITLDESGLTHFQKALQEFYRHAAISKRSLAGSSQTAPRNPLPVQERQDQALPHL